VSLGNKEVIMSQLFMLVKC